MLDRPPSELDVAALRRLPIESAPDDRPGPLVELPVVFDGPDLVEVARLTGRPVPDLVAALTGAELTVAFGGFAPGFGYLTGLPPELHVPRRSTPRTRVPAGSVGLAGPFAGAYPRASPGGATRDGLAKIQIGIHAGLCIEEPTSQELPGVRGIGSWLPVGKTAQGQGRDGIAK